MDATQQKESVAGESPKTQQDIKGKIIEFAWHLKREQCTESTIRTFTSLLRKLVKLGADLSEPETVKDALARNSLNPNTKTLMVATYTSFLKFLSLQWNPPKCKRQDNIPFIPLESEIDELIAGCTKTVSAILQLLKETGMRIGEALRLKWTEVNTQNSTIIINEPEKNSNPRIFKVSAKLIGMLQILPRKSEKVFGNSSVQDKETAFRNQRKKLALKLGNPRLAQITFHTLGHWKGTMEYHKTKSILHVKQVLGHKRIENTMRYINLEQAIFQTDGDEFHVKVAESLEDACKLLEVGFEYVTDMEDKKLFRKRK